MTKFQKIKKLLNTKPAWVNTKDLCNKRLISSFILLLCSVTMILINTYQDNYHETIISELFSLSFLTGMILAYKQKPTASAHSTALSVAILMTITLIKGKSESFAVLWLLTVPIFAINMLDLKTHTILNTYLLIMIISIFWTPIRTWVQENYNIEFIIRFPIMYITLYLISAYMTLKNEYKLRNLQMQIYTDSLTCAFNRAYFEKMTESYNQYNNFSITVIDINNLKTTNDTLGHKAGDELICSIPECCEGILNEKSVLCRTGGDEFCILSFDMTPEETSLMMYKLKEKADKWSGEYCEEINYAYGTANKSDYNNISYEELYKKADTLMYKDKKRYYKQHKINRYRHN